MASRKSYPSLPEANRLLQEHELARHVEAEKTRVDGVFAGIARQHENDRRADVAWRDDHDIATVLIARACGIEEQLPPAIRERAKASPAAAVVRVDPPKKPAPALPAIGRDARTSRLYALAGLGAALINLAIEILRTMH